MVMGPQSRVWSGSLATLVLVRRTLLARAAKLPPCPLPLPGGKRKNRQRWRRETEASGLLPIARPPARPLFLPSFHLHRRDLYHAQRTLPNSIRDSAPACAPASTRRVDHDSYHSKLWGVARALVLRTTQGEHIPLQSRNRAELSRAVRRGAFGGDRQTVGLDGGYSASCVGLSLQEWPWPSQGA